MMSGQEFVLLLQNAEKQTAKVPAEMVPEKHYEYGIAGIAKIFGCSIPTANRIKKSGVIDAAITQVNRKITMNVVPFPALWDIQTQRLVLHLSHLGEIVVEDGDAVALGRVERAVGRNQVPVLIVRHETPRDEVVEVIFIPSKKRVLVYASNGATYLDDLVPELLLLPSQRLPFFRAKQLAGYVRDVGILRLQEQREVPQSKIAKHLINGCKITAPTWIDGNRKPFTTTRQGIQTIILKRLAATLHLGIVGCVNPRLLKAEMDIIQQNLDSLLHFPVLREGIRDGFILVFEPVIYRNARQQSHIGNNLRHRIALTKRQSEILGRIPGISNHPRRHIESLHFIFLLLDVHVEQCQKPIEFVRCCCRVKHAIHGVG